MEKGTKKGTRRARRTRARRMPEAEMDARRKVEKEPCPSLRGMPTKSATGSSEALG